MSQVSLSQQLKEGNLFAEQLMRRAINALYLVR